MITLGCIGPGTARRAGTGSVSRNRFRPIRCGRRKRTPSVCPARSGYRHPALDRAGAVVASGGGHLVAAERRRSSTCCCSPPGSGGAWCRQLGRVPERDVGADPVPVAGLADRKRLGGLQQPAVDRLLHHHVHRRPAGALHGAGHVPGIVDTVPPDQQGSASRWRGRCTSSCWCWFLLFILIHVTLVFTTGLLRNLNHIYAGRNDDAGSASGCSRRRWWSSSSAGWPRHRSPSATPAWCNASATR